MKNIKFILILFFNILSLQVTFSQTTILSETEKIAVTGKVWGFLKYYHPNVANGTYNWDNQLFGILARVQKAETKEDFSKVIEDWIVSLGEVKKCKSCKKQNNKDYFDKNLNLEWLKDEKYFSKSLTNKLSYIEGNRHQGKQHYISWNLFSDNIELKNEVEYKELDSAKKHIRLLILIRYWNIVEYFFPYKYQMDQNWDESLQQMIPVFSNADTEEKFHLAMLETVTLLNDSHVNLTFTKPMIDFFGNNWIPASFKIIDEKVVITGLINEELAKKDDIKIGDIIVTIDNKSIAEILNQKGKYRIGSNNSVKNYKSPNPFLFNGNTDKVTIEYIRDSKISSKTLSRYPYSQFNAKKTYKTEKYSILKNNIGYVDLEQLEKKEVTKMMTELKNTKSIIFDVRNYPKEVTIFKLSKYLNSKKKDVVKFTKPDLKYPGKFIWYGGVSCGKKKEKIYKGNVIILVDYKTQSKAETIVMALQTADNSIVIGDQTAGANGNICEFTFFNNIKTRMTGLGTFYPDGTQLQRIGIVPDISVQPTIEGIKEGKDEILERALLYIETGK